MALAEGRDGDKILTRWYALLWRLEPLLLEKKAMWRREMDWLLCVSDHIVERVPTWQTFPDGTRLEETLESFRDTEFWYVDQGICAPLASVTIMGRSTWPPPGAYAAPTHAPIRLHPCPWRIRDVLELHAAAEDDGARRLLLWWRRLAVVASTSSSSPVAVHRCLLLAMASVHLFFCWMQFIVDANFTVDLGESSAVNFCQQTKQPVNFSRAIKCSVNLYVVHLASSMCFTF